MTQEKATDSGLKPNEKWRILKNVAVVTAAFMLHFIAYNGAANLQSSINSKGGLGTVSLAILYVAGILSNMFLPAILIRWLGTKWTLCFSFITYMPYIAAQWYPSFYTMIPAAFLVGLGAGPLWCAKCTYLSVVAEAHSTISKIPAGILLLRFLGFFFMIYQMNQIWGNLISSLVLSSSDNVAAVTTVNETMIPQLYESYRKTVSGGLSGFPLLAVTMKQLADSNQLLLVMINIFIGQHQAFFSADFTASFVTCAVGTGSVGYVMMTYGLADAAGCLVTGYLAKVYGRLPLIIGALFVHGTVFVTILSWQPHAGNNYVMFIMAVLWGACDSVWTVQINAYYGVLFQGKEEAAFSNYRLWEAAGYIFSYVISTYVRTRYKIYMLLCNLIIGVIGYLAVEYRHHRSSSRAEERKELEDNCVKY